MDYENLRMKEIPIVSLTSSDFTPGSVGEHLFNPPNDTGVYFYGKCLQSSRVGSLCHPCHANMASIFTDRGRAGLKIYNLWDSMGKLAGTNKDLGNEILYEFYLGVNSPWKALFPYLRVLKAGEYTWLEFSQDEDGDWSNGMKSLMMNFCIALRTPFEGHHGSRHVSINYGVENIFRLMKEFGMSYREALYFNRICHWGTENKDPLKIHSPKALTKTGFVHHFLAGLPDKWLKGHEYKLNDIKTWTMSGNDSRLWGTYAFEFRPTKAPDTPPLVQGAFARYDLRHLADTKIETAEDYIKYCLSEIRSKFK